MEPPPSMTASRCIVCATLGFAKYNNKSFVMLIVFRFSVGTLKCYPMNRLLMGIGYSTNTEAEDHLGLNNEKIVIITCHFFILLS